MPAQVMTTDPRGCSFLSYRRKRSKEAALLIRAQRERGIPTWQDVRDLDEEHTSSELRRVLEAASTANAVMWITPEVADSSVIQKVEAPCIMERAEGTDSFFVIPVAAGGADYGTASDVVGADLSLATLEEWNIRKVTNDPAREADAREIANRVLIRRVQAIHGQLPLDEPLTLGLFVRCEPPVHSGLWLAIDWTERFDSRHASETTWKRYLLPALEDVVRAIEKFAPGRRVVASGRPSIGAAFAMGRTFLAPRGLPVSWEQFTPGIGPTCWGLTEELKELELKSTFRDANTSAEELAVLISVNAAVEHAFAATRDELPVFRGIVDIRCEDERRGCLSAGQAVAVARKTVEAVREARETMRPRRAIHLFMAVPVGLSFLIGQLSNTLGPIQVYEHEETDAVGRYVPGALLHF